jgi:alpha-L-fucosidase
VVIQMLADIVSKNGDLLLNIPVRSDGTLDDKEERILGGIADWMDVNRECIFGTRPWKIFGEGPASDGASLSAQGFNEGLGKPFSPQDVRFTTRAGFLYAIVMADPGAAAVTITSLSSHSAELEGLTVSSVSLLGLHEPLRWTQDGSGLVVSLPRARPAPGTGIYVLRIGGVL